MDKIERRAQIPARARDVFAKRGYHAAKIEDIVAAAKDARGTFYLYFEHKGDFFDESVDRFIALLNLTTLRKNPHCPSRNIGAEVGENRVRDHRLVSRD